MRVRHAPRPDLITVGARMMTRDVACSTYPPGSWAWNQWGCGASAAPAAPVQSFAPAPTPAPSPAAPPPAASAPSGPSFDAVTAQRLQAEYGARIAAEAAATEEARRAAAAQADADALRAAKAAADAASLAMQYGPDAGAASMSTFSTLAPSSGTVEFDASTLQVQGKSGAGLLALLAAGIGAALVLGRNRRRR